MRQSPAAVSVMPTGSPTSTWLRKISSPAHFSAPLERTRRTAVSLSYSGSQAARIGSRRGDEERGRRPLTQGFMGTHLVVLVEEAVEARLLGAHARCRWLGSGLLERPVEALVAAVLLRPAGLGGAGVGSGLEPRTPTPR